jgi:hypothetical protein
MLPSRRSEQRAVVVIQMSDRGLTRLRVMIDLADGRLMVEAAATLMGLGRRQIFRLRRAFAADGPSALASRKCGHPSNRRHDEAFRRTILALVREHYPNVIEIRKASAYRDSH